MAYSLETFIGKKKTVNLLKDRFSKSKLIALDQGFAIFPMVEELSDEITRQRNNQAFANFDLLNKEVEQKILDIIGDRELAYVESSFAMNMGGHIGIIWKNGERVFEPDFEFETMNAILKRLGVVKNAELKYDEFETLGLGRYRRSERWIERA